MSVDEVVEKVNWSVKTRVTKRRVDEAEPYAVEVSEGNLLLNAGITEIWNLVTAAGGTAFSNANARIGVGNGITAAGATQTGLVGASTAFKAMNTGFPSITGQTVQFEAEFGTADANFAWEEWVVDNGLTTLNRKVTSFGTKPNTEVWTLTVDITLS